MYGFSSVGPEALPVRVLPRVPPRKQRHEPVASALRGAQEQRPPAKVYQRRPDRRLPDIEQVLGNARLVDDGQRIFTATGRVLRIQRPDLDDPAGHQLHALVLLVLPRHDGLEPLAQFPPCLQRQLVTRGEPAHRLPLQRRITGQPNPQRGLAVASATHDHPEPGGMLRHPALARMELVELDVDFLRFRLGGWHNLSVGDSYRCGGAALPHPLGSKLPPIRGHRQQGLEQARSLLPQCIIYPCHPPFVKG